MSDAGFTGGQGGRRGRAVDVRGRAAMWLVQRCDSGHWSKPDQSAFESWLAESPAHRIAYLRVDAAWQRADRLKALRRAMPVRKWFPVLLKAAGGVAALAAFVFLALPGQEPTGPKVYTTGIGGHESLSLNDGTQIELNTDTSLRVATDSSSRTVWIDKGEAYFNVVHDKNRPFTVIAGSHRITDLGTQFLVRRHGNAFKVELYEGRARFDTDDKGARQQAMLTPGDVLVATAKSLSIARKPVQVLKADLAWQKGLLIFHHESLAKAAAEFNRYNRKKIVVADSSIAQLNINGAMPAHDVDAFARSMKKFFNLHVEDRGNALVITR